MAKTPRRSDIPPRRKGAKGPVAGPARQSAGPRRPVPQQPVGPQAAGPRAGGPRPVGPRAGGPRAARLRIAMRRRRLALIGVPAIVAIVVVVALVIALSGSPSKPTRSAVNWSTPTGVKVYGALGPEGVPLELGPALGPANAGLTGAVIDSVQCNTSEQLVYHHHIHLAIFLNGQPRSLPLGVGLVPPAVVTDTAQGQFASGSNTCLYWLHVHAQDGIVHIESPSAGNFVLGQVFAIWHQALASDRVGSYRGSVTATVDGRPFAGDVAQVPLAERTQIVVNLGAPVVTPPPINWSGTNL